jgi:hypothetical protein
MKNILLAPIAIGLAGLTGGWLVHFPVVHEVAGRIFHHGKFIAIIGGEGIFEADLSARARHKHFCAANGDEPIKEAEKAALRDELIAAEALRTSEVELNGSEAALATFRHQFADDRQFRAAPGGTGISLCRLSWPTVPGS